MRCLFKTYVFCLLLLLLLPFLKCYGPICTFVSNKIFLHSWRSLSFLFPLHLNPHNMLSPSSTWSSPFFLVPSFASVTLCFSVFGFAFFPHHHTILVGGTFTIFSLYNVSFIACPFILHRSFAGPCIFLTVFMSNILSTVVCSLSLPKPLTHRSVWVVLGVFILF